MSDELTSIRKLLDEYDFDWERGVIVIPDSHGGNVFLPENHPALDRQFVLFDKEEKGVPLFTAEDPMAMYLLCNYPEAAVSVFHKVAAADLEGIELNGIRGYPHGPMNSGIDLSFTKGNLEVFVTRGSHYPAIVGCPEIHFYCVAGDRKDVMDIFTMRLLSGYLAMKKITQVNDSGVKPRQGYIKLLEHLFLNKLGVEEDPLQPIADEQA